VSQGGYSEGFEVESIAGINFVESRSLTSENRSNDNLSTVSSMSKPHPSSMRAVSQSGQDLVSDQGRPRGLNARMRKRLIEREVEWRGQEGGLSMESILLASKSISEDERDERYETGQDDMTNDGRSAITFDSAPFHSPYEKVRQTGQSSSNGKIKSLPMNAELISVADDEESRRVSPTNWNEWDCPVAVKTPVLSNIPPPPTFEEGVDTTVHDQHSTGQPNRGRRKPGMLFNMIRRFRGKNEETEIDNVPINDATDVEDVHDVGYHNIITILDERDDVENKEKMAGRPTDVEYYYVNGSERRRRSGKKRRIHRLQASSPQWVSEGPDRATGFMHIGRDGDSITAASVELSYASFHAGLHKQQRPVSLLSPQSSSHHTDHGNHIPWTGDDVRRPPRPAGTNHDFITNNNPKRKTKTNDTSSTAWKHPGRIATDYQRSTPLSQKLNEQHPEESPNIHHDQHQHHQPQHLHRTDIHHHHQEGEGWKVEGKGLPQPVSSYESSTSIRSALNLPPSGVRLIKKTSSLAKLRPPPRAPLKQRSRVNSNSNNDHNHNHNSRGGRIGAAPMMMMGNLGPTTRLEMTVESNDSALVLGSIDEEYGGMELEWGHAI
jgi:hypothetical protein